MFWFCWWINSVSMYSRIYGALESPTFSLFMFLDIFLIPVHFFFFLLAPNILIHATQSRLHLLSVQRRWRLSAPGCGFVRMYNKGIDLDSGAATSRLIAFIPDLSLLAA